MKAIENGIAEILHVTAYRGQPSQLSQLERSRLEANVRAVLKQVIQEAFKEVINADDRKS